MTIDKIISFADNEILIAKKRLEILSDHKLSILLGIQSESPETVRDREIFHTTVIVCFEQLLKEIAKYKKQEKRKQKKKLVDK